ncbi:MAG: hypothetical protein GWM90_15710 [Gemmatimonadetes bacterium]|nr:histidine phosphatase family protein [Gemmatimonadota bacterium]NIQ55662.1 histidine phosphatase family protein [Gemmatimonadota bacterium]NIU75865.1 hypothetical protein [Gammaproteobacteria bacterium]NIX45497.1 hypothetical protein [Gemmatimonadota bacterium]NIY09779.1 hypothetical protein [Gemmatimonadota bacterium]
MRRPGVGVLLGLVAALAPLSATAQERQPDGPIILLVRHGETTPDGSRDPALSPEGRERALRLAAMLADAGLDAVYTTDYARTRGTAGAVAERLGLEPTVYDPGRLGTFAEALRGGRGRVLVVGHSNTTPALVTELGGDPGTPIREDEHDRLYVLVVDGAEVRTILVRY